jgi:hypothetical protein
MTKHADEQDARDARIAELESKNDALSSALDAARETNAQLVEAVERCNGAVDTVLKGFGALADRFDTQALPQGIHAAELRATIAAVDPKA